MGVVVSGVISSVTILISHTRGTYRPYLLTTHAPPSRVLRVMRSSFFVKSEFRREDVDKGAGCSNHIKAYGVRVCVCVCVCVLGALHGLDMPYKGLGQFCTG